MEKENNFYKTSKVEKTVKKYYILGCISNVLKLNKVLNLLKIMVISSYAGALKLLEMGI